MKKNIFNYLLPAVLMLGLCSAFVSCKDEELTEEEKQQKQEQENDRQFLLTSEFWQVVGQLSNAEVLPEDWQHATFEPGIGEASDKSATMRIVPTNEAGAAAESFENLTGADVTGLDYYEWKRDFGTLTYQRLHDGTGWAAVEVDIKQMPGLKRIVYCTPEQQGLNASVPGTPYYRFGDVIKKENAEGKWEYWVCVRPCFGPEKKGDMHWMCLGTLPESNIKSYTYTKQNRTWYWPVSLTTNYEHIKNLSEMTCAILEPERWANHYESNQNEYLFHDFSYTNIKYHNRYFWQLVQDAWNTPVANEGGKTVFDLLFHRSMDEVKAGKNLNYFYSSASGPGTWSWYMNIPLITVTVRPDDSNVFQCRDLKKNTLKESCEYREFDIKEYSQNGHGYRSDIFKTDAYIYPLRYATGKQLLGSQPNYYQSMGGANKIQDVYVFNEFYEQPRGSDKDTKSFDQHDVDSIKKAKQGIPQGKPMNEVAMDDIGKVVGKDGNIYNNVADAQNAGTKALAMVAAIARTDFEIDYIADRSKCKEWELTKNYIKHAIALALEDAPLTYEFPDHAGNSALTVDQFDSPCTKWVSENNINVKGARWCFLNSYYYQRMSMDCGAKILSILTIKTIEEKINNSQDSFTGMIFDSKNLLDKMEACGKQASLYEAGKERFYTLSDDRITYEDEKVYIGLLVSATDKQTSFSTYIDPDNMRTRHVLVW